MSDFYQIPGGKTTAFYMGEDGHCEAIDKLLAGDWTDAPEGFDLTDPQTDE